MASAAIALAMQRQVGALVKTGTGHAARCARITDVDANPAGVAWSGSSSSNRQCRATSCVCGLSNFSLAASVPPAVAPPPAIAAQFEARLIDALS